MLLFLSITHRDPKNRDRTEKCSKTDKIDREGGWRISIQHLIKKNFMDLTEDIEAKKLKQNINNLSIIEILRQPSLSLFSGIKFPCNTKIEMS